MQVLITEFMDEAAFAQFPPEFQWTYDADLVDTRHRCLAEARSADALIVRNRTRVNAELLDAAPNLRVVGRLGVGLDNIDLDACAQRGIEVCPATGANTRSVAEYVIAGAMILSRGAFTANAAMCAGSWPRGALGKGGEIAGRRLGLVGFGGIAQAVAALARPLGMSIAACDPHLPTDHPAWHKVEALSLDALLSGSDVVSLHVPLTPQTANLVDASAIARMTPGAILINTARGGIVDEAALCEALRDGRLGGAALDVFAEEPLSAAAGARFEGVPNLILTPHIAGVTEDANARVSQLTVQNVIRALRS